MKGRGGAPKRLGTLLQAMDLVPGERALRKRERLDEAWTEAAGSEASRVSRPEGLKGGTLTVLVRGSAWLQELSGFRGEEIRRRLAASIGKAVDRIRFRLEGLEAPAAGGGLRV
ncbi:MAG: DUF721 domain-containing protein [Planctomycetota bacterium]